MDPKISLLRCNKCFEHIQFIWPSFRAFNSLSKAAFHFAVKKVTLNRMLWKYKPLKAAILLI